MPLASKPTNSLLSNLAKTPSLRAPSAVTHGPRTKKTFSSPVAAAALNADPDIAPMLKAQRELEKQLREVKEELDTAEQARKIEVDSHKNDPEGEIDGELVELIDKWKGASRLAAEELFGKVRDRVNRYVIRLSVVLVVTDVLLGWVDQEPGRKCRRSRRRTGILGIKRSRRTIMTLMTRRTRMLRSGMSMLSMVSIRRRRTRSRSVRRVWVILENYLDRKM